MSLIESAAMRNGRPFKAVGRPRLTQELRDVVIRIGSENLLWGYKRIAGELKKLGLYAGANSVKRILNEAGIHPSPEKHKKKPALPWTTFVQAHMESMVACDFFTKTVLIARGPLTAYALIFIHLGSRRVYCSAPTYAPGLSMGDTAGSQHAHVVLEAGDRAELPDPRRRHQVLRQL